MSPLKVCAAAVWRSAHTLYPELFPYFSLTELNIRLQKSRAGIRGDYMRGSEYALRPKAVRKALN